MDDVRALSLEECERRLRRGVFGRFALAGERGVEIVPVNYAVVGREVVARTSRTGLLARCGDGQELVFEVDLVEHEWWHGWSVVARGTGVVGDLRLEGRRPLVSSWAAGDDSCELRMAWTELSGREVGAGWDGEAAMWSRKAST